MRSLLPLLAVLVAVGGCDTAVPAPETAAVYVANQGIFSDNSGTLSRYDPQTGEATPDAVTTLGGLVQGVEALGGRLYVFLNFSDSFGTGSGRIAVLDPASGAVTGGVDVGTPRAWAVVDGTAFVTNFYGASVTPVDLATTTAGAPIPVGANPEGVAAVGDRVYVANYSAPDGTFAGGSTVTVLSAATRTVVETIDVGCEGPRFVFADGDGEVWVVCTGRTIFDDTFTPVGEVGGAVVVLAGATGAEVRRFDVGGLVGGGTLGTDAAQSRARAEVYVLGDTNDVLVFDTAANRAAGGFQADGPPLSAIAFDDEAGRFYLGRLDPDAPFSAPGTVTVHDRAGVQLAAFDAGVLPTAVAFSPVAE